MDRLALWYVERFATTRAKLVRYLNQKLRARGWEGAGPPDPDAIANRFAALGYVDDRAFAEQKAAAMTRRGLGAARVRNALREAGVEQADADGVAPLLADARVAAAIAYARRKRIGAFARETADRAGREKQLAAMVRGGHDFAIARALVALDPGADAEAALAEFGADLG